MKQKAIKDLYQEEENFFWHRGRRALIEKILKSFLRSSQLKILDVGCGTGGNAPVLGKFGELVGVDPSEKALVLSRRRGGFAELKQGRGEKLDFPDGSFDLATAFDVLEHIKDDNQALSEWYRVLKKGGYLFLTVPAYQWLFSEHDKVLGHFRRYNLIELRQKVKAAGFEIVWISYFLFLLFPLALVQRFFSKIEPRSGYPKFPDWLNNLFTVITLFEVSLFPFFRLPWGLSAVLLAKKPKKS